jgi:hypothetical protein
MDWVRRIGELLRDAFSPSRSYALAIAASIGASTTSRRSPLDSPVLQLQRCDLPPGLVG